MPDVPGGTVPMDISVVICTHSFDRESLLTDLVTSIAQGNVLPREVIIAVDSNVPLREALLLRVWAIPVTVLSSPGAGLAAARNAGWQAATSGRVAFIDDDALASPEWLAELLDAAERYSVEVVGGWIEPQWVGKPPSWFHPMLGWVVGCSYDGLPRVVSEVRNVIGCNMLIARDVLERLGGFDVTLGRTGRGLAGCEETEFCLRASTVGAHILSIPGAPVAQILPEPRGDFRYAIRRAWAEGRSKRALVAIHGPVLQTETRYARALIGEALRLMASGSFQRRFGAIRQAAALVLVLCATSLSYVLHAIPQSVVVRWRAADSATGGGR